MNGMSDDLINRKAVINALIPELNEHGDMYFAGKVIGLVNDIPTAFDKEKVMAKLRSEYMDASNMYSRLRGTAHSYSSEARKDAWEKRVCYQIPEHHQFPKEYAL